MGLRKILTDKDPALHKVCKEVTAFDEKLHKLLDGHYLVGTGIFGIGINREEIFNCGNFVSFSDQSFVEASCVNHSLSTAEI